MYAKKRREALRYHRNLPQGVWFALREHGVLDLVIYSRLFGWHEERLTVPIFDRRGDNVSFERYEVLEDGFRLDEEHSGTAWELYGWDTLLGKPRQVVICEGSLERLVLGSRAMHAISITGFSRTLKAEWLPFFRDIREVFICFKRSDVSTLAAEMLAGLLPNARVVALPPLVGEGGGLRDYFVRLKRSRADFLDLLEHARNVREAA